MIFFCGRDDLFHFALPISAIFGFKFFSNAALRAGSLPILGIKLPPYDIGCFFHQNFNSFSSFVLINFHFVIIKMRF